MTTISPSSQKSLLIAASTPAAIYTCVPAKLVGDDRLSAIDKGVYLCAMQLYSQKKKITITSLAKYCKLSAERVRQCIDHCLATGWCSYNEETNTLVFVLAADTPTEQPLTPEVRLSTKTQEAAHKEGAKKGVTIITVPPAVAAVRQVTKRYPQKALWDLVVERVGDDPDVPQLKQLYDEWIIRGYSPVSLKWLDRYNPESKEARVLKEASVWNTMMEAAKHSPDYHSREAYEAVKESFINTSEFSQAAAEAIARYEESSAFKQRFN